MKTLKLENETPSNTDSVDLQSFVIRDGLASRIFRANLVAQLQFQAVDVDRCLLREQGAAKRCCESQTHTTEQNLNRRVRPRQSLQDCRLLLEEVDQNGRQNHTCKKTVKIIVADVNGR